MRQPTFRDRFTARDLMNQDEDYFDFIINLF